MANEKHFTFVAVSKDGKYLLKEEDIEKASKEFPNITFDRFENKNNEKLTTIYNSFLSKVREDRTEDYLILMHSDVRIDLAHLMNHIIEVEGKYDILGLCGTRELDCSASPLNWFTGSHTRPKARYGTVYHGELGNQCSIYNDRFPNVKDIDVACIDGLCIIFTRKALYESDIRFDERFMFDQYDTDLSLEATINKKLRLGIIVEPSLQHFSVGKSIIQKKFLVGEIELRKKWSLSFPKKLLERLNVVGEKKS